MNVLNATQLAEVVSGGAKPVTITTTTVPDLVGGKSCPLAGRVQKVSRVNGFLNFNYQNAVNRQLGREDKEQEFEAHPRKWGNRKKGFVYYESKGEKKVYLEVKVEKSLDHEYYVDGEKVSDDVVKPYLRPSSPSRQGTDKEVIVRDYRISNILKLCCGGQEYVLNVGTVDEERLYDSLNK